MSLPPGVKVAPRVNFVTQGKWSPLRSLPLMGLCEHTPLFRKMEEQIEDVHHGANFTPRANGHPEGQNHPLGANVNPCGPTEPLRIKYRPYGRD
jgi:hypothetical protein